MTERDNSEVIVRSRVIVTNPILQEDGDLIAKELEFPVEWITVDSGDEGYQKALDCLKAGRAIGLMAHGRWVMTTSHDQLHPWLSKILDQAKPVLQAVWIDNLWPSVFGTKEKQVFTTRELNPDETSVDAVRQKLYQLGAMALESRSELRSHVGYECLKYLSRNPNHVVLVDSFMGGKELTAGKLLAASLAFASWLKKSVPEKRVGVVLPPGAGVSIVNLGCVLASKVPVNLNFTAGHASNMAAIRKAELKSVITAEAMKSRLPEFPWPEKQYDIKTILTSFSKLFLGAIMASIHTLPVSLLASIYGVSKHGDQEECGLLFTSGSSGEPKGVVYTHRNILANTAQISSVLGDLHLESMLGCLPIFHSFGCTVTFWWPLMGGPKVITYPNPTESNSLIEIIHKYRVSLFCYTPTFLRAFVRRATRDQLKSIQMVVTGAEKLPQTLMNQFEERFQVPVCEGYGMTEATPVVSVNLIPSPTMKIANINQRRNGSVGPLLPGIAVSIRNPENNAPLPLGETGMLWLKGANIFTGYLNEPDRTAKVLENGWYKSGDLGRLDEDGFLYIEGRLSRFSKIGGEMVPHGTLEQKISEILGVGEDEDLAFAIAGIPDESKGEALVLLAVRDFDWDTLRRRLLDSGVPALWIPKIIRRVESIPTLASGKLDLQKLQVLALGGD